MIPNALIPEFQWNMSKSRRRSNRVSWKANKIMILNDILWISKSNWKENFPARCVLVVFIRKWNFRANINPNFLVRDSHSTIWVNFEGVLLVVRGKFKNETVAIFYDVYGVSDPQNEQFSLLRLDSKSVYVLKQKRSVSWKKIREGGKWIISAPSDPKSSRARWNLFFAFAILKVIPNPNLKGHFASRPIFNTL